MKNLNTYLNEELISLYKRYDLFVITQYIKNALSEEERPLITKDLWIKDNNGIINKYSIPFQVNFFISMRIDNLKHRYDEETSESKKTKIQFEIEWLKAKYQAIRLFASGWLKTTDEEKSINDSEPIETSKAFNHLIKMFPDEFERLTMNDDINLELGRATDFKVYQFIYETLQYCSNDEIEYLLKFADKGLKTKWENVDMSKNASKKIAVKVTNLMPEKKLSKYSLSTDQVFESQKALAEYCNVSIQMIRLWKKDNLIEEI